ncbi:MAG: DUF6268 family outer membrane beta-barrel protein [Reichenbachiella sp.]|uniref:DUF6268 family outer membrane beta-barrel protein n=1 Tax=Reichenbachiella sp. TaxID=2184521 RepID=UPI0032658FBA
MKTFLYFALGLMMSSASLAQEIDNLITPYRPKIAEFSMETLREYDTSTSSESFGSADNEVERDRLIKAKIGIPFLIKENWMFGIQLKYYQHQFTLDLEDQPTDYDLYLHLNAKKFTSTGIRTFYQRDIKDNQQLRLIGGAELKSDQIKWNANTTKYFISSTYTWQRSSRTQIGTGFVLNQVMGRTVFYPLFIYEKQLTPRWTLDLTLPKSAAIRYRANERNFITASADIRGWRYNLTNALEDSQRDLTLRKVDLQFSLSWEHELHDWLWFGLDIGYTKNLQYHLANPGDSSKDALIDIRSKDATYTKFSVFIVPPRKFYR